MSEPHILTERAWIGAAVKAGRTSRGLKQRELVELVDAAGLPWTQGILAKVEVGTRDVSLSELLIVCVCLGTTPSELLFAEGVAPEYLELSSGKRWNAAALGELLDGNNLTGDLAAAWSFPSEPDFVVLPDEVLDLASMYLDDPDAVDVAELSGLTVEEVAERVSKIARKMIAVDLDGRKRRRWTTRELVDLLLDDAVRNQRAEGKDLSSYAVRALRVGIVKQVAAHLTEDDRSSK